MFVCNTTATRTNINYHDINKMNLIFRGLVRISNGVYVKK